jgi:hypothetical protein
VKKNYQRNAAQHRLRRVDDLHRPHPLERSEIARTHSSEVKNWQNGTMALRWCAVGRIEAGKQFRRVNGHLHLPALRAALDAQGAAHCRHRPS